MKTKVSIIQILLITLFISCNNDEKESLAPALTNQDVVETKVAYRSSLYNFIIKNSVLHAIMDEAIVDGVLVVPEEITKVTFQDSHDETTITSEQNDKLKEVIIGDSESGEPVVIANWAFDGGLKIEKITLGKNVQKVGIAAFRQLNNLKEITIKNPDISFDLNIFYFCDWAEERTTEKPTLYIPKGSLEVFKAKENFKKYINDFVVKFI